MHYLACNLDTCCPFQVKRPGVLLLEFANVLGSTGAQTSFGNRNYDWGNKLTISLNVSVRQLFLKQPACPCIATV